MVQGESLLPFVSAVFIIPDLSILISILLIDVEDKNDIIAEASSFVREEPPQDDSRPPMVDSEVEILHEKVKKQIIKEGHGQKPAAMSTCFCKCHDLLYQSRKK